MIDPYRITNFFRNDVELQEFWLFSIIVAGKVATTQAKKLEEFLHYRIRWTPEELPELPFDKINHMVLNGELEQRLKDVKMGQYSRIVKAFEQSAKSLYFNLDTASTTDLEKIHGVSFKTSRFFIMHSRPNVQIAALDTHVLKYLKHKGFDVPKNTPSSASQYGKLEKAFLSLASQSTMTLAEFDLAIWTHYANKTEAEPSF